VARPGHEGGIRVAAAGSGPRLQECSEASVHISQLAQAGDVLRGRHRTDLQNLLRRNEEKARPRVYICLCFMQPGRAVARY
jgi:hypothetical protein